MKTNDSKIYLYFSLALLPSLMGYSHPPADSWGWMQWAMAGLYQGLLAVKAYQSDPTPPKP